jgi:hypothetical protein
LVAAVALPWPYYGLGMLPAIGGERAANFCFFLEVPSLAAADIPLVTLVGLNQFTLCYHGFITP